MSSAMSVTTGRARITALTKSARNAVFGRCQHHEYKIVVSFVH